MEAGDRSRHGPDTGWKKVCPGVRGYQLVFSPYNPDTGLFYVMSIEQCDIDTARRDVSSGEAMMERC